MAKILLIEPNSLLSKQYETFISGLGHHVEAVFSAQAAIARADKRPPDLVIMELLLNGHSGIEFLNEFRSYAEWRDIPVIILSRLDKDEAGATDIALKKLGVDNYLYKPETSLKRLSQRIESSLNMSPIVKS